MYGVSCDARWSQTAFREKLGVSIPQLSDFEPKGAACRAFGVYHPGGFPQRALVIVGPDAVVAWSYQAPSPADLPGANLIFDGLDAVAARSAPFDLERPQLGSASRAERGRPRPRAGRRSAGDRVRRLRVPVLRGG